MTKPKRKIIQIAVSTADETWITWALCDDGTIWARTNGGGWSSNKWSKIDTNLITQTP